MGKVMFHFLNKTYPLNGKKVFLIFCMTLLCTIIFILILGLLLADRPGTARNAQVNIGSSTRFTHEEIESAANIVIAGFRLPNSELTHLWYDEDISNFRIERSHLALDKESTIILTSTIVVRRTGPGWMYVGTHEDYGWVLSRDNQSGEWILIAQGFWGFQF